MMMKERTRECVAATRWAEVVSVVTAVRSESRAAPNPAGSAGTFLLGARCSMKLFEILQYCTSAPNRQLQATILSRPIA